MKDNSTFEDFLEISVLDVLLQPGRQTRVHGRATGQHDVLVIFCPRVDIRVLKITL